MRVIPPEVPQPQATNEKPPTINDLPLQATQEVHKNGEISATPAPSINNTNLQETEELQIRKKREYKAFIKLVKQGKFTSAMITAKVLGVSRPTIQEWLQTKAVKLAMNEEVTEYVSKIKVSKDWKAQAYLLDKLEDKDKENSTSINLNNLIQINTVSPSQE